MYKDAAQADGGGGWRFDSLVLALFKNSGTRKNLLRKWEGNIEIFFGFFDASSVFLF